MTARLTAFTAVIAVATATAMARTQGVAQDEPPAQAPPIFRAATDVVIVHANVFDNRSDAVPNLPQGAFQVFENDVPQDITFFSSADVPVAVGLIVDNSGSMIARRQMV